MDAIALHGIEVWAHHGVLPDERERGQPFRVHVRVELDLGDAGRGDDLAATVDYGRLAEDVAAAAGDPPCALLEAVAERVAAAVLGHDRVHAVEVTVEKPRAPLPVVAAGVDVTVRRDRGV